MTAWVDQLKDTIPDYAKDTRLNIDAAEQLRDIGRIAAVITAVSRVLTQ